MTPGINFDQVLDALADKLAERLRIGQKPQITPRLLSVEQAAQYLSRSPRAVRLLAEKGILPGVRMDDRLFFDIADLDRAIEAAKG
jgi:hypothetical protein